MVREVKMADIAGGLKFLVILKSFFPSFLDYDISNWNQCNVVFSEIILVHFT